MNISAINCSPIKPQVAFGKAEGVEEANKVLNLSKELSDSFKKEESEGEVGRKSPMETIASLTGAALAMFAIGKGAGKLAYSLSGKIPETAKTFVTTNAGKAKEFITAQTAKLPKNEKISKVLEKTVGKVATAAKTGLTNAIEKNGAEKIVTTAAGLAAATTLVPKIAKADGNGDGIADIAQKNVNAYQSAFKTAEIFADMVSALS